MVTPNQKPSALIFGRTEGAPYHPLAPLEAELSTLFASGFDVKATERSESLLALGMGTVGPGGIDLVVGLDDRWTEPLDRKHLDAVEAWVRSGGTLLLVHNGICWARDNRWRRLVGARFAGHGPAKDLTFTRRSDGASFVLFEEPYRFTFPWFSQKKVLVDYADEGGTWPALWTRRVGKGTIAYALPGHSVEAFRQPVYRDWLLNVAAKAPKAR